ARDRAGERPLFFAARGDQVIFATEIAPVVSQSRLPVHLDQRALRAYLQFGIFPSPNTPFSEIQKVAPGAIVRLDGGAISRKPYWRWRNVEPAKQQPSLSTFNEIFRGAVARQSDVDVDFGVFLSGGLDSSLVSAVTRALYPNRPLKAYTLRFEEESYADSAVAEIVAHRVNMDTVSSWTP